MAYDKEKSATRLAAEFERIATECPEKKATSIVASAIAGEIALAFAEAEVEVRVKIQQEIAAVPATVAIDETVKGVLR